MLSCSVELKQLTVILWVVGAHFLEGHVLCRVDVHVILQLRQQRAQLQILLLLGGAFSCRSSSGRQFASRWRRVLGKAGRLRHQRRFSERLCSVRRRAHLGKCVFCKQPRVLPRVEHVDKSTQIFSRHLHAPQQETKKLDSQCAINAFQRKKTQRTCLTQLQYSGTIMRPKRAGYGPRTFLRIESVK